MTFWEPWTIVLPGFDQGAEFPILFLRFFTRRGAQKWLREWQSGARSPIWASVDTAAETRARLREAYVARVDRVKGDRLVVNRLVIRSPK